MNLPKDRVQNRLDALLYVVRTRPADELTRHVQVLAYRWRYQLASRPSVRVEGRDSLERLAPVIAAAIRRAVAPGRAPAQVLAASRAMWQLIDGPGDAGARRELAAIGRRLADSVLAGEELEAGAHAERVAGWTALHETTIAAATRRVLDEP